MSDIWRNQLVIREISKVAARRLQNGFYWYKTFEKCVEIDSVFAFVNHVDSLANNGYICCRFFDAQN